MGELQLSYDMTLNITMWAGRYMSTITFSSVGYGDIVPMTIVAKLIVMLEVALRFFVLVFGIANINQIRVNQN